MVAILKNKRGSGRRDVGTGPRIPLWRFWTTVLINTEIFIYENGESENVHIYPYTCRFCFPTHVHLKNNKQQTENRLNIYGRLKLLLVVIDMWGKDWLGWFHHLWMALMACKESLFLRFRTLSSER